MTRGRILFDQGDADSQREDRFLADAGIGDYRAGLKREDQGGFGVIWSDHWSTCKVCQRLDNDLTPKPCRFCRFCSAWICLMDWNSAKRRAKAALGT